MSARKVCNMSPAELEKKRQIDRDNQRHFRNKRKTYVQKLENEVSELKQELQAARAALEQGSTCCSCRASSVSTEQLATPPSTTSSCTVPRIVAAQTSDEALETGESSEAERQANLWVDLGQGFTISRLDLEPSSQYMDITFGDVLNFGSMDGFSSCDPPASPQSKKPWETMPVHLPPSTTLDETIDRVSKTGRTRLLERRNIADELNHNFPSISSLLNPSLSSNDASRPLSTAIAAHIWTSSLTSTPSRIAFMYTLSNLLRWFIYQDEKSYNQLPEYLKPTQLQCTVPHPAWIDTVIWPDMRDEIIKKMDWNQFEEFRDVSSATISVNWLYTDSGTFVDSRDGQNLLLNPLFEMHIRKLENWSLGPIMGEAFPFLKAWCSEPKRLDV